jgi:hypothetical protein
MDPSQYGPHAWLFIHAVAGNATEEHKRVAFARWLNLLPDAFPCEICAAHLRQTMKTYPIERFMASAEDLLRYTYILHDSANNYWSSSNPGKPRKTSPPWEEVRDTYLSLPSPEAEEGPPALLPAAVPASSAYMNRAPHSGSRMMISHPAFQQLKSNFHTSGRHW